MVSACLKKTTYEHIGLNEEGFPVIAGTNMKITELVLAKSAYGWSSEELRFQFPHLTLGQIYSALAYYSDHQEQLDRDIDRRMKFISQLRRNIKSSPLAERFRSEGLL